MTTIVGKDASLQETLKRFKQTAEKLSLELVEDKWLNPLPDLWSVHLSVVNCPVLYSNGKGSSKDAALASAYGEIYERLATHMSFADYYLGYNNSSEKFVHFPDEKWIPLTEPSADAELDEKTPLSEELLNSNLRKFYTEELDLHMEDLIDLQSSSFERGVCAIPFTNPRNGEIVYFPVNLLDNLYASNGMSAGNTEHEALVQGLSEIIERYVKGRIISQGLALPQIPNKILEKYPKSFSTLQALQSDELKAVCYDASLGGKYPVVCVVMFNQSNGTCVASFGSHPIFEVALDRTLTELMQGRTFSDLDGFEEPSFDLERTSDMTNLESHFIDSTGLLPMQMFQKQPMFKFVSWDFDGTTHEQYKALSYIIENMGLDVYIRSYPNLGIPVYRIIVPGMSEVYPKDDLVYNNNNAYIIYQESLLNLPVSDESCDTYQNYLSELEDENIEDSELVAASLGILPDPNSAWESLRFGELKCLIALAAQNYEQALEYAQWTVLFNRNNNYNLKRLCFYQCLIQVLECMERQELDLNDYQGALGMIYGEATLRSVIAHIKGQERFNNLLATDMNLLRFKQHYHMIEIYMKIKHASLNMQAK